MFTEETVGAMGAKATHERAVERIHLAQPLMATVGGRQAAVRDVSLRGCMAEHDFTLKVGTEVRVSFEWHGEKLALRATAVRSKLDTFHSGMTIYQTGLSWQELAGSSLKSLRKLITDELVHSIEEQKANARGDVPRFVQRMAIFAKGGHLTENPQDVAFRYETEVALPYYRIARERGYVRYTLQVSRWIKTKTRSSDQPEEGFTIWAHEDAKQIEGLCEAYERGDHETRWLIRTCAELSLIVDDSIPPQRFLL